MLPATLQSLIGMIACATNERMQRKLDYTREEVRVLKEVVRAVFGTGRIVFTAERRRRLAVSGKALSPDERRRYCQIVNHFVFFGERHLRYLVKEFMERYLAERFPQGLGGQLIKAQAGSANDNGGNGAVVCRSRLCGMLNYYYRKVA